MDSKIAAEILKKVDDCTFLLGEMEHSWLTLNDGVNAFDDETIELREDYEALLIRVAEIRDVVQAHRV